MFNSPINKLFGIPPVGQGGKQEQGKKDEKENSQKQNKNIWKKRHKKSNDTCQTLIKHQPGFA